MDMKEYKFGTLNAPNLEIKVKDGDNNVRRVQFEQGVLTLTDKSEVDFLRKACLTNPQLSHLVREIDEEAALELVKQHQQDAASKHRVAHGSFSSAHMSNHTQVGTVHAIREEMVGQPEEEIAKAIAQLEAAGLPMTEDGTGKVVRNNDLDTTSPDKQIKPADVSTVLNTLRSKK